MAFGVACALKGYLLLSYKVRDSLWSHHKDHRIWRILDLFKMMILLKLMIFWVKNGPFLVQNADSENLIIGQNRTRMPGLGFLPLS